MKNMLSGLFLLLLLFSSARGAFEPVSQSPWLNGGISSSLFPRSPLSILANPASTGLMECPAVAVSASRPFGLRELDRTAAAGNFMLGSMSFGTALTASGDGAYTEITLMTSAGWKLSRSFVAAAGLNLMRLHISGYGRATGGSADLAAVWSPAGGLYSTVLVRSLFRSGLGNSGDPAAPRSVEAAIGAVPVSGVRCAAGITRQEELDMEYSFSTVFSPASMINIGAGGTTSPARFWVSLEVAVSDLGLGYGYGQHSTLPETHSVSVRWGSCAFRPEVLDLGEDEEEEQPVQFPLEINSATEEELQQIPGIGPSKASAIAAWLRENGPVTSLQQLIEVPGVGPSIMETLQQYLVAE
ncbi:MAG: hypothetical protein GF388_04125 [Candidatus Aegiribacteria sp.]|nr:hypothetical protein [Candidatus Aegiribacteria sp.]MBD3294427.1 hypothetical protein [Candidatus Fermentibacteria bacterium]